jgi:hypothetical protein
MRKLILVLFVLLSSNLLISQSNTVKNLEYWQTNFNRAGQIYLEIHELANAGENDSLIYLKSIEALNCIKLGIAQCEEAKINDRNLTQDANFMITRSCLQGAWFNQIEETNRVFTDSLARSFIKKCFILRPNVTEIPYYELKYKPENVVEFEQLFFDQVFLSFLHAVEDGDNETVLKMGKSYIDDMYYVYGDFFPANIFTEPELNFEQSRIFKILKNIIPLTDDKSDKLNLSTLMIEYLANFYFDQKLLDSEFSLIFDEKNLIAELENDVVKNIHHSMNSKQLYLRLADSFFLLDETQKGIDYYSLAVLNESSDKYELKHFIELTKSIADTADNVELSDLIKNKINEASLLYKDKYNVMDDDTELKFLYETFLYAGNLKKAEAIQSKILEIEAEKLEVERVRNRREQYGFRIGFAPLKLLYLNKYSQFSVMGDIKISGFEQGFRYCQYNGFTDKYRFGAWMYVPDGEKSSNTYSGYEISYWVTLGDLTYEEMEQKLCLEARVGVYNFETLNANIVNRELDYIQFYDNEVNPVGHRYDLSLVYRVTIFSSEIFFLETNFAMGLGYRYLTSEFSNDTFIIDDVRYSDSRWPMITAPIRFGFRAGIRFL